jgi:HNH endonuclease
MILVRPVGAILPAAVAMMSMRPSVAQAIVAAKESIMMMPATPASPGFRQPPTGTRPWRGARRRGGSERRSGWHGALFQTVSWARRAGPGDRGDFEIGCRVLTQPFFFTEGRWISVPVSWSPNIVSLKTCSPDNAEGLALWESVNDRIGLLQRTGSEDAGARFGEPHLIRPRLGQGAFRVLFTDIYRRRCAVTQERTLPALEAAHIRPYGDGGEHEVRNGLLLRRDIHSLFDAGYVTVTPDLRFEVGRRIRLLIGAPDRRKHSRCNRCLSFAWYFWMHRAHA